MYQLVAARVASFLAAAGRHGRFVSEVARGVADFETWVRLTAVQMRRIGVQSLPVSLFIAAFTGIVLSLQSRYSLQGAVPLYFVGTLVGKTIMLELAPVLTGLGLAGRVGASIAAEIGTMRVTEQVDALETLAYDPNAYLVVPRVVAGTIMFPIVVALAMAVGLVFGWLTAVNLIELSTADFVKGLRIFYQFKDLWFGLVKSASFGLLICLVGCYKGLTAGRGAVGVGKATTEAVVIGAQLVLLLDAFWAVVLL